MFFLTISIFLSFFDKRSYTKHESYPLQNTIEVFLNQHRLLDFLLENLRDIEQQRNISTIDLNLFGLPRLVFTNNVPNIEYILKTNFNNYGKGPILYRRFFGLLGDGIFNADNDIWYHHRKTSAHIFNVNKFRTCILSTFNEKCDTVIETLRKHTTDSTDFQDLMFRFTLDSIGLIAFNFDIGALKQKNVQFAKDFDYCQEITNQSFIDPLWYVKRYLSMPGLRYFAALNRINSFAYGIIKERRNSIKNDYNVASDLLSLYLKNDPLNVSDKELRDVIINFIIAGRDTTAQALSWAMFELCKHKHIQEKIRIEISEVLKSSTASSTGDQLFSDIQRMKYIEMVCLETLRLHPSVPKEAKHCFQNDTLPDGTIVYKGDLLVFSPWCMGRNETLWGHDCLEFIPERFSNNLKPNPYKFTAFQAGPRQCLGQTLAILEMKVVLFRLLQVFEFEMQNLHQPVTYINTITLPIKDGLQIIVKEL